MNLEVTVAVRIGARSRNGGGHIQSASEGTSDSGDLRDLCHLGVVGVKMQSERSARQKDTFRQCGAGFEAGGGVAMNDGSIVRGEMTAGMLDGGRERVPVNSSRGDSFGRGQDGVKIVDFKISVDGERGEFAAGVAGKARPAVNRKGQFRRSVGPFQERRPLPDVMAGEGEAQR